MTAIAELFARARDYLGETITIGVHMRQAGALAEAAGAAAPLVAAALLHDVGYLRDEINEPRRGLGPPGSGVSAEERSVPPGWHRQSPRRRGSAVAEPVVRRGGDRTGAAARRGQAVLARNAAWGTSGCCRRSRLAPWCCKGGPMTPEQAAAVRGAAVRAGRGGGPPLGRPGQGPGGHAAGLRALRAAAQQPAQGSLIKPEAYGQGVDRHRVAT